MQKRITKVIVILFLIINVVYCLYIYRQYIIEGVVKLVASQLDKEREKDVGQYNIITWNGGLFEINHNLSQDNFEFKGDDFTVVLLEKIYAYKIKKDKLYIVASDGYAVVDENDNARILITNYNELDGNCSDYEVIRDDKRIVYSKCYNDEHITYLCSFNEFSKDEQKKLSDMQ